MIRLFSSCPFITIFCIYPKFVAADHHFNTFFSSNISSSFLSSFSPFFPLAGSIRAPSQFPHRAPLTLFLTLFASKQRGSSPEVTAGLMDSRGRRQVAGSPALEPTVGVHPPRGAKLPARLPQPHLWLGRRSRAVGSAPVRPALGLTWSSSHHHTVEGLFLSEADLPTLCATSKSEERQANGFMFQLIVPQRVFSSPSFSFFRYLHCCKPLLRLGG